MQYREEKGTVTEVRDDTAVVLMKPGPDVDCSSCCGCASGGSGEHLMEVERGNLQEGDRVRVRIPSYSGYTSMALVFGLPMLLFLCGLAAGNQFGESSWYPLLGGGIGLAVAFAVAWLANSLLLRRAPIQVRPVPSSDG